MSTKGPPLALVLLSGLSESSTIQSMSPWLIGKFRTSLEDMLVLVPLLCCGSLPRKSFTVLGH